MLKEAIQCASEIDTMPKEPPIGVRFQSDVKAALEKLAKAEDRTIGNLVNRICAEYLRAREADQMNSARKMIFFKMPDTLWNREYGDKPRLRQFRRAVKEGNKPSRWYYDNPADKGSAYRRRYVAALEVAADIIENSPCEGLAAYARSFVADAKGNCL